MYNPDQGDTGKEWVELFNAGEQAIDLGGWIFGDLQDQTFATPIPAGNVLASGEALILVEDATRFDAQWGAGIRRIELGDFPSLANSPSSTNETPAILDSNGVTRDAVNYDDEGDWPTDISDGPSIYLRPGFLTAADNDHGSNWFSSTPGVDGAYYSLESPFGEKASPGIVAQTPTNFPEPVPSPNSVWSMAVFPDTQNYVKTEAHLPQFVDMAEWVRDQQDAWNIELVLHEGDIVNKNANENPSSGENPSTLQWQNARSTMALLDGHVPYILAVGNHDVGINNAENDSTRLNDFFSPADNPLVDPQQGGILKGVFEVGRLENAYYEMTAPDGRELLVFSLAWDPDEAVVSWANRIVGQSRYDDHTAILLTHSYLNSAGIRSDQGEFLWEELVRQHENFEMVLNGHFGGDGVDYLASTGDNGNLVHQMVFNTQFEGNGGNGWLRMLEFLADGRTVQVQTFTPTFGFVRSDPDNQFQIELTPLYPADFTGDGEQNGDDLLVWQSGFGADGVDWTAGDANGDAAVLGDDFLVWQRKFTDAASGSAAVNLPEPPAAALFFMGLSILWNRTSVRVKI